MQTRTYCVKLQDLNWDYAVAAPSQEQLREQEENGGDEHEDEHGDENDNDNTAVSSVFDLTNRFVYEATYQLTEDKPKLGKNARRGYLQLYTYNPPLTNVVSGETGECDWEDPVIEANAFRDGILGPTHHQVREERTT